VDDQSGQSRLQICNNSISLIYLIAKDIPGNYVQARGWLLNSAARNDNDAWNALGVIYSQGLDVEVDGAEAVKDFRKAADAGFEMAQYNLGYMYYVGKLVPRDYTETARQFKLAADQGHVRAGYSLGMMYRDGQGVPQNTDEALRIFQQLAERHHLAAAQHNLGAIYYLGKEVPKDFVLAYMWVSLAADAGLEASKNLLSTLIKEMTVEQIREAKQKVQEWTRTHAG